MTCLFKIDGSLINKVCTDFLTKVFHTLVLGSCPSELSCRDDRFINLIIKTYTRKWYVSAHKSVNSIQYTLVTKYLELGVNVTGRNRWSRGKMLASRVQTGWGRWIFQVVKVPSAWKIYRRNHNMTVLLKIDGSLINKVCSELTEVLHTLALVACPSQLSCRDDRAISLIIKTYFRGLWV